MGFFGTEVKSCKNTASETKISTSVHSSAKFPLLSLKPCHSQKDQLYKTVKAFAFKKGRFDEEFVEPSCLKCSCWKASSVITNIPKSAIFKMTIFHLPFNMTSAKKIWKRRYSSWPSMLTLKCELFPQRKYTFNLCKSFALLGYWWHLLGI